MEATMLVDLIDMNRIENTLLERRNELIQSSSWIVNLVMLGLVVTGFGWFLYAQYQSNAEENRVEKHIPFTPVPWLSATRNVRMEEYGRQLQPSEAQTGYGIPGPANGSGRFTVRGDHGIASASGPATSDGYA